MKTQIGLGVLGIPFALQTLGMVPGIICLLVIAAMTTCRWLSKPELTEGSDYVVGTFKIKHPEVCE